MAAYAGAANVVKSLLTASVLLGVKPRLDTRDDYDQTSLCWAAQMGHRAVVKLLLRTGRITLQTLNARQPYLWSE